MKKEKTSEKNNSFLTFFESTKEFVQKNYPSILLFLATFIVAVVLSLFRTVTEDSVSRISINDFQPGQIAMENIYSPRSIAADSENPVEIQKGEQLTRQGWPIDDEEYAKLKKLSDSSRYTDYRSFANSVLFLLLLGSLFCFMFSSVFFGKTPAFKEVATECVFFIITYAAAIFVSRLTHFESPIGFCILLPATLCSFLVAILFGQLNAFFFAIFVSFSILDASSFNLEPFFYVLSTSLVAARLVQSVERRIDLVFVSLMQSFLNVVFLFVFKIIFKDSYGIIILEAFGLFFNGFISGILCLGLLTPIEYILNTASVFRLLDLSDLNAPTIKNMQMVAGGTYNHSIMVANLAESACGKIGANPLLARVGAYYHDIGKTDNPEYFTENQDGKENIHNEINPSLSVSIIKSHVKKGVEKAKELRLPQQIIDIISEHHGNQVIAYFYNEAKEKDPNAKEEDYAYTGTPPSSRESAVVMLADTVEAACRSLDKPSIKRLEKFISQLINAKIEHNQLDNCGLTFKDLAIIKETFVQVLASHYHSRVKYPDQKDPDTGKTVAQEKEEEKNVTEKDSNVKEKDSKDKEKDSKDKEKDSKDKERDSKDKERDSKDKEKDSKDREKDSKDKEKSNGK